MERHKFPAGEVFQRFLAIGLRGLVFRRDSKQVLPDQRLLVRIEVRKSGGDISAHLDTIRGLQPDMRVLDVLTGKRFDAVGGRDGMLRRAKRIFHKVLQPEAVQHDHISLPEFLHLRNGQRIVMQARDAFRHDQPAA